MPVAAFTFGSFGDIIELTKIATKTARAIKSAISGARREREEVDELVKDLDAFTETMRITQQALSEAGTMAPSLANGIGLALSRCCIALDSVRVMLETERQKTTSAAVASKLDAAKVWRGAWVWNSRKSDALDLRRHLAEQMGAVNTLLHVSACSSASTIVMVAEDTRTAVQLVADGLRDIPRQLSFGVSFVFFDRQGQPMPPLIRMKWTDLEKTLPSFTRKISERAQPTTYYLPGFDRPDFPDPVSWNPLQRWVHSSPDFYLGKTAEVQVYSYTNENGARLALVSPLTLCDTAPEELWQLSAWPLIMRAAQLQALQTRNFDYTDCPKDYAQLWNAGVRRGALGIFTSWTKELWLPRPEKLHADLLRHIWPEHQIGDIDQDQRYESDHQSFGDELRWGVDLLSRHNPTWQARRGYNADDFVAFAYLQRRVSVMSSLALLSVTDELTELLHYRTNPESESDFPGPTPDDYLVRSLHPSEQKVLLFCEDKTTWEIARLITASEDEERSCLRNYSRADPYPRKVRKILPPRTAASRMHEQTEPEQGEGDIRSHAASSSVRDARLEEQVGRISDRFLLVQSAMTATEVTDSHLQEDSSALLQSSDEAYRMAAIQPSAPNSNPQLRNRGIIGQHHSSVEQEGARDILTEHDIRGIFAEQDITDHIGSVTRDPLRYGGFADIHVGLLHTGLEITRVAIKFVRAHDKESLKVLRRHKFEMKVWGSIDHPNIIPLLGLYWTDRELPGLVSPWCESGDINAYLKSLPGESDNADRKCQLLQDVGRGLSYLHERGIVHGDLKGANILISDNGVAGLCDFGLSRIVAEVTGTRSRARGTIRWMAPELFDADDAVPTPWSDMWAYGCVIVEVFSGSVPYASMKHDEKVIIALYQRQLPERPTVIPDAMWELALRCLTVDYRCRARPSEVLERILFAL